MNFMLQRNGPIIQKPQTTRLNQDGIGNLNSPKTIYEIAFVIKKLLRKKSPDCFTKEFYLTLKKNFNTNFTQSLPEKWKKKHLSAHFITLMPKSDRNNTEIGSWKDHNKNFS